MPSMPDIKNGMKKKLAMRMIREGREGVGPALAVSDTRNGTA